MSYFLKSLFGIEALINVPSPIKDNIQIVLLDENKQEIVNEQTGDISLQITSSSVPFILKLFPVDKMHMPYMALINGKRAVGKTTLVKDLVATGKFQEVHVFSCQSKLNHHNYLSDHYGEYQYEYWKEKVVENIIKKQKTALRDVNGQGKRIVIVVEDDGYYEAEFWKSPSIAWILFNGRSANITLILCSQYPPSLSPSLRSNLDYCFFFRDPYKPNRRTIHDKYAGMFPTFEVFDTIFEASTENYAAFVVDNAATSDRLDEQVFFYRASIRLA